MARKLTPGEGRVFVSVPENLASLPYFEAGDPKANEVLLENVGRVESSMLVDQYGNDDQRVFFLRTTFITAPPVEIDGIKYRMIPMQALIAAVKGNSGLSVV